MSEEDVPVGDVQDGPPPPEKTVLPSETEEGKPDPRWANVGSVTAGRIMVTSVPPGATVRLGTIYKGETPLELPSPKDAGEIEVNVSLTGYKAWSQKVKPDARRSYTVRAMLVKDEE